MEPEEQRFPMHRELRAGETLGEGGMGRIVEGLDEEREAATAVKILLETQATNAASRAQFDAESRLMASLEHPGCLPIYGWGVDSTGLPFYAMKKLSGKTLADLLVERGQQIKSLVWRHRLLKLLQAVCETIAYAHQRGIVHRDLKPDNIIIDSYGAVYVIDWGIARQLDDPHPDPHHGAVIGTPGYMSPEQAEGKTDRTGPAADVFSLGVILYEIITGRSPFLGKTTSEALAHTCNLNPHPPGWKYLAGRSLSKVCMSALEKDPSRRYQNASGLADDMTAINEGRRVSVIAPSLLERTLFYTRREPIRAAVRGMIAVTLLTLALIYTGQLWLDHRIEEKGRQTIAHIDQDVAELDQKISGLRARISSASPETTTALKERINVLQARKTMLQVQAINTIRHLKHLRFLPSRQSWDSEGKAHLFSILESEQQAGRTVLLHAWLESLLEEIEEGTTSFSYTPAEISRLRQYLTELSEAPDLPR